MHKGPRGGRGRQGPGTMGAAGGTARVRRAAGPQSQASEGSVRAGPSAWKTALSGETRARGSEWYGSRSQEVVHTCRNVVARGKSEDMGMRTEQDQEGHLETNSRRSPFQWRSQGYEPGGNMGMGGS